MASSLDEQLRRRGWFLNKEAIAELTEGAEKCSADDVIRKALDTDLCEIGSGSLPDDLTRNLRAVEKVSGPAVWQIQRVRNAAAPKADPENDHGNKYLRLYLTDGVTPFSAVLEGKCGLSVQHTPPGTKLLLNPQSVSVCNGFVLLSERDFKVLGGTVQHLVDKWKLAKDLSHHKRTSGEAGPPPWVPFGEQIDKDLLKQLKTGGAFKAMDKAGGSKAVPNEAFERHRMSTIEEVTAATQQSGGKRKVFGGGAREMHDADIATICARGFSAEAAGTALRNNNYNVTAALNALSIRGDRGDRDRPPRGGGPDNGRENNRFDGYREDGGDRGDRGPRGKKGPREMGGPRTQSQYSTGQSLLGSDGPSKAQPSAPTTLFDMISTQVNLPEQQHGQTRGRDDVRTTFSHSQHHSQQPQQQQQQQSHGHNGLASGEPHQASYESNSGQRGNRNWSQGNAGGNTSSVGPRSQDTGRGGTRGEKLNRPSGRDDLSKRHTDIHRARDSNDSRSYEPRSREIRDNGAQGSREYRDGGGRSLRTGTENHGGRGPGPQRGQRVENYVAEFPTLPASGQNAPRRIEDQAPPTQRNQTSQHQSQDVSSVSASNDQHTSSSGVYSTERNSVSTRSTRHTSGSSVAGPVTSHQSSHKLRTGQRVYARYWEDGCMYRAVVHEMSTSGQTCVVSFVEYGNYEEVLMQDIEPMTWDDDRDGADAGNGHHYQQQHSGGGGHSRGNSGKDHHHQQQQQRRPPPISGSRDGGMQRNNEHSRGGRGGSNGSGGNRRAAGGGGSGHRGGYRGGGGGGGYRPVPRRQ